MAKKAGRKLRKHSAKSKEQKKALKGFFNLKRLTESYVSLILGAIVVLIAGILFISFSKENRNTQTSSTSDVSSVEQGRTSSTYTVNFGDDLWSISEKVYSDGYKWVAIARANKINNPGLIYPGTKLLIPVIISSSNQEKVAQSSEQIKQINNSVIRNNSIVENTYAVIKGDNLWDIAVRAYGDGFRWHEIARANNLINPNLIHPGNVFKIPR